MTFCNIAQKKRVSAPNDTPRQIKDERRWILQNVLSAAKLPSVSYKYARDDDNIYSFIKEPATPRLPTLVGKLTTLHLRTCHGLPSDLTNNEKRALCLAIKRSTVTSKLTCK